jgi:hypothetical protein
LLYPNIGFRYRPVWDLAFFATSSGVPVAMTRAAGVAALWAEVDDPIGALDDIEVVLDDDECVAGVGEPVEDLDEFADVLEVEAGGRLVEDVEGVP